MPELRIGAFLSGSPRLDRFLIGVHGIGLAAIGLTLLWDGLQLTTEVLLLSLVATAAAPFVVSLGENVFLSPTFAFVMASAMSAGPVEAALTAATAGLSLGVARRKRMPFYKAAFNLTAMALSALIAGHLYRAIGGDPTHLADDTSLRAFLAALCGFYFVNTFLVASAASREHGLPVSSLWVRKFHWAGVSYLAGGSVGLLTLLFLHKVGPFGFLLTFPFCALVYQSWMISAEARLRPARRRGGQHVESEVPLRASWGAGGGGGGSRTRVRK